jgi:hypothetical protein
MMIAALYARRAQKKTAPADERKSVLRQVDHARPSAQRIGWTVADDHVYIRRLPQIGARPTPSKSQE